MQTYAAAARAAVALYGEGTRWATASRWKEANALSQLGRQVCGLAYVFGIQIVSR